MRVFMSNAEWDGRVHVFEAIHAAYNQTENRLEFTLANGGIIYCDHMDAAKSTQLLRMLYMNGRAGLKCSDKSTDIEEI